MHLKVDEFKSFFLNSPGSHECVENDHCSDSNLSEHELYRLSTAVFQGFCTTFALASFFRLLKIFMYLNQDKFLHTENPTFFFSLELEDPFDLRELRPKGSMRPEGRFRIVRLRDRVG